jgi:hypothetical protein
VGEVEIERAGYGKRGETSLHPLDAELNLPKDSYSLGVRRRAAEEAAKNSFDEVAQTLKDTTGAPVPKRQVEELAVRAAQDFDAFYIARHLTPNATEAKKTGSVMVITTDGKGVVMRKEDLREETKKAAEMRTPKLSKRVTKGEKRNAKRMATVAAVYTIKPFTRAPEDIVRDLAPVRDAGAPKRPRPENKRVWASLEKEPAEVIEDAFLEATHRDPPRQKTWTAVVDGNKVQLDLLKEMAENYSVKLTIVLDLIHVLEYLWDASHVFNAEGSQASQDWVSERLLEILHGNASNVAAGIRRSATLRQLDEKARSAADACADYLLKYAPYLRYDEYLAKGLPIASGVIEGACRHLVKDRMDITGARWGLLRAEAVLKLRALRSSGDFDEYWTLHQTREQQRNHQTQYDKGAIPTVKANPRRSGARRLSVVK